MAALSDKGEPRPARLKIGTLYTTPKFDRLIESGPPSTLLNGGMPNVYDWPEAAVGTASRASVISATDKTEQERFI
jgi:hypothetical protein